MEQARQPKGAFAPNDQSVNGPHSLNGNSHDGHIPPYAESRNGTQLLPDTESLSGTASLPSAEPPISQQVLEPALAGAENNNPPAVEQTPGPQPAPQRHGYRQDSPPEVIDLLHRAQAGDTEAFAGLYRSHLGRVTRYVGARMRDWNRDAIPDVVQDTFCEAFADLPAAHHDVAGWLLAHAAKACLRHDWSNRRYVRAAKTMEHNAREEQRNGTPCMAAQTRTELVVDPGAGAKEQCPPIGRLTLVHALARLATDQRRAMQLRFIDGLPRQERATAMDRSLDALQSLEWRALGRLRASLGAAAMDGAVEGRCADDRRR
jgi:RNA polymerase sigma-70 factor, ECF subfamily